MKLPALLLLISISVLFNGFMPRHQTAPQGYALIVSVPKVHNQTLREKYKLAADYSYADLKGASTDGEKIKNILLEQGFSRNHIIVIGGNSNDMVTEETILAGFAQIAAKVKANDLFVFYYSGHGDRYDDEPGGDEADGKDEVFVTWKSYLKDDKINSIYKKSFTATRNIMIVDACRAGSMYELFKSNLSFTDEVKKSEKPEPIPVNCRIGATEKKDIPFSMLYLGASRDENYGYDTGKGGYFTAAFKGIYNARYWQNIKPRDLACRISNQMQSLTDPGEGNIQYTECGNLSVEFKNSYLFKIK